MLRRISTVIPLFLLLGGCGADVNSTLDRQQQKIEPVVIALEAYRQEHETYPDSLDRLVEEGLLDCIPDLPEVPGTLSNSPLSYKLSPDGSFYFLKFWYDFPDGIGPAEFITRFYVSDDQKWDTAKYPPSFDGLVAIRSGKLYQEKGSYKALEIAVEHLTKGAAPGVGCVNLFDSTVRKRLGPGEKVGIPANLSKAGDTESIQYASDDKDIGRLTSSCFGRRS